jgi:hypothetical protein
MANRAWQDLRIFPHNVARILRLDTVAGARPAS